MDRLGAQLSGTMHDDLADFADGKYLLPSFGVNDRQGIPGAADPNPLRGDVNRLTLAVLRNKRTSSRGSY